MEASARKASTAFFSGMRFELVACSNSATVKPLAFAANAEPRWSASSRATANVSAESVFQNCLPSKKGLAQKGPVKLLVRCHGLQGFADISSGLPL